MKKQLIATTMAALLALSSAGAACYAAPTTPASKTLNAVYGVQIEYNSKVLSSTASPFIVDNTTYVPLRMLVEAFDDKTISWDNENRKVVIAGKGLSQSTEQAYMQQITSRNTQITELNNQITTLKAQVASLQSELDDADSDDVDTDDIDTALTDSYGTYDDVDFSYSVSGDEDDITVTISTDEDDWSDLSTSTKTTFLQYVCNKVWKYSEDADVSGTVKDGSTTLTTFSADAGDDVSLSSSSSSTLSSIQSTLNSDYGTYYSTDFEMTLSGDSDDVTLTVDVDSDDWDDFSDSRKTTVLQKMCSTIWDTWEDADITIKLVDGSTSIQSVSVDAGDSVEL